MDESENKRNDMENQETERKVAQLRIFCMAHNIEYDPGATRSELLCKVRNWRKHRKQLSFADSSDDTETKDELAEFSPPDFSEVQASIDICNDNNGKRQVRLRIFGGYVADHKKEFQYALVLQDYGEYHDEKNGDFQNKALSKPFQVHEEKQLFVMKEVVFEPLQLGKTFVLEIFTKLSNEDNPEIRKNKVSLSNFCKIANVEDGKIFVKTPNFPPAAPVRIHAASCKKRLIKVRWEEGPCNGGCKVLEYHAQVQDKDKNEFVDVYSGRKATFELSKIEPGSKHKIRVRSRNKIGLSDWSVAIELKAAPAPPSRPGKPRYNRKRPRSSKELHVEWDRPEYLFGTEISGYRVEMAKLTGDPANDSEFSIVLNGIEDMNNPECCTIIQGLKPRTKVKIRVLAFNVAGESPFSEEAFLSTEGSVPDIPEIIKVTFSEAEDAMESKIKWQRPSSNGSSVVEFMVESSEKNKENDEKIGDFVTIFKGSATSCISKSFQPGKTYQIRVRARNEYGWSEPALHTFTVQAGNPLKPGKPELYCENSSMILRWTNADEILLNGSTLTKYELVIKEMEPKSITCIAQKPSKNGSIPLFDPSTDKLSNDVKDEILVESLYTVGKVYEAKFSQDGLYYIAHIEDVRMKGESYEYLVKFIGYGNLEWVYESNMRRRFRNGENCIAVDYVSGNEYSGVVTAVTDEEYYVKFSEHALPIQKTKVQDISKADPVSVVEPLSKLKEQNLPTLNWKNCEDHTVIYRGTKCEKSLGALGLKPGNEYEAFLRLVTDSGISPLSDPLRFTSAGDVPTGCPSPELVRKNKSSIMLHLLPPYYDNGSQIEGWQISMARCALVKVVNDHSMNGSECQVKAKVIEEFETVVDLSKTDFATIRNLQSGKCYAFRTRARNSYGFGDWSPTSAFKTEEGPPLKPLIEEVSQYSKGDSYLVNISFKEPVWNGGSAILGYLVEVKGELTSKNALVCCDKTIEGKTISSNSKETTMLFALNSETRTFSYEGAAPGSKLTFRLQAKNHIGTGSFSAPETIHVETCPPDKITGFSYKSLNSNTVRATWNSPGHTGGSSILGYEVQIEPAVKRPGVSDASSDHEKWLIPPTGFDSSALTSQLKFCKSPAINLRTSVTSPEKVVFVRIRALNKKGAGDFCDWALLKLSSSQGKRKLELSAPTLELDSLDPIKLTWNINDAIPVDDLHSVLEFREGKRSGSYSTIYKGQAWSFTHYKAVGGEMYQYRVRLVSKTRNSPFSSILLVKCPKDKANVFETSISEPDESKGSLHNVKGEEDKGKAKKTKKSKLVKASKALKWRKMPWYKRYPLFAVAIALALFAVLLQFLVFLYYA